MESPSFQRESGSSIARLRLSEVAGYRPGGESIVRTGAQDGRIFIIENEPMLDTALSGPNGLRLTLYGLPGRSYRVESRDAWGNAAPWTLEATAQLNGTYQAWEHSRTNEGARFFRAVQP